MENACVLVVDDSSTIRRVVSNGLRGAGYRVHTAERGGTGVTEARAAHPDIVLVDHSLPDFSGVELAARLNGDDNERSLGDGSEAPVPFPVILLVTRADAGLDVEALRRRGVVATLRKPFDLEEVVATVARVLRETPRMPESTRVTQQALRQRLSPRDIEDDRRATASAAAHAPSDGPPQAGDPLAALRATLRTALLDAGLSSAIPTVDAVFATHALRAPSEAGPALAATHGRAQGEPRNRSPDLAGELGAIALPEVLQLLKFQSQTGLLCVDLDDDFDVGPLMAGFQIGVRDGVIVSVRALGPRADVLLGQYVVGNGFASRSQIEAVSARGDADDRPLGTRLVAAGVLTTEQLRRCVHAQAEDLMTELLRAGAGRFRLYRGTDAIPDVEMSPGLSVDGLLFEALRRIDEWAVLEEEIPSLLTCFELVPSAPALEDGDLGLDEIEVLALFRAAASLSVREILARGTLRAFHGIKVVHRLVVSGHLRRLDLTPSGGVSILGPTPSSPLAAPLGRRLR